MTKDVRKLVTDAIESFIIIKDSLALYYQGKQHMFKPIAGQLRILYCDTKKREDNSLLHHIYPDLKLIAFHKYESKVDDHNLMIQPACYRIIKKGNGLQIADIDFSNPPSYLCLKDWRDQVVDSYYKLSVQDIIRSVADKGGGAHIDIKDNLELSLMKRAGPAGVGLHILFIIALARYTLGFAKQFAAEWVKIYPDILSVATEEKSKTEKSRDTSRIKSDATL